MFQLIAQLMQWSMLTRDLCGDIATFDLHVVPIAAHIFVSRHTRYLRVYPHAMAWGFDNLY